jgi:hypothetical protein
MRKTGETAFVGFGSAIVGSSENAAVQAKLNLTAQKIAALPLVENRATPETARHNL